MVSAVEEVRATRVALSPRRRRARRTEQGVVAALAVLLVAVVFANGWGTFAFDTKPELYQAPWPTLLRELSAWRPSPHLGEANYHLGFAPVVFVVWLIRSAGAEPWVAARILRACLLLIGAWGVRRHVDQLAGPDSGATARTAAAVVFVANPYAIVSGATLPVLLPYAFLPWLLLAFTTALRTPRSWRGPAGFALAFFLMGGMNAGVVPLFSLLALPCYVGFLRDGRTLRGLLAPVARCAVLALAVSAYWLVPSVLASGSGSDVAANTERPDAVASTSSWAESLRGLGMWTMYGRFNGRLSAPGFAVYLTSAWAVLATFALPVAAAVSALVSRARARLLAAALLAVALPVMVGLFPPSSPSPLGRALALAFAELPAAIAFRTTNKAGAVAALGLTLLVALGAEAAARRARRTSWGRRAGVGMLVAASFTGATLPAWTGDLHPTTLEIPDYWREAAADIDAGDPASRVLFVPGQSLARYRWGYEGVDDLEASLLTRQAVWRGTVPSGSRAAANFLAALDVGLNEGALRHGDLPAFARYAGVGEVLLRNDTEWELVGGARPAQLAEGVAADPELERLAAYGEPGSTTVASSRPEVAVAPEPAEAALAPLERFAVRGARPVVRTERAAGAVLVDGDNFALPALRELGLLDGEPAYRLLGAMTPDDLAAALADGARMVLTDSNRRRDWDVAYTGASFSPTLPAGTPMAAATSRTLFADPEAQTVGTSRGGSATATSHGSPFFPTPFGQASDAFDGDPATAWTVGSFNTALGQSLTVTLDDPVDVSRIVLRPLRTPGVRISRLRVTLGDRVVDRTVPDAPVVELELPRTRATELTLEITELRGSGRNAVGFTEVEVPGVQLEPAARLPLTLDRLAAGLDEEGRRRFAAAPLDVVLARQLGDPEDPADDEERRLTREFRLPGARSFTAEGRLTAGPDLPDPVVDALAGVTGPVRVTASSRAGGLAQRAAKAFDGDLTTAWVPAPEEPRPWIEVSFPEQVIGSVGVDVREREGAATRRVTEIELDFGDGDPVPAALAGSGARVQFRPRTADRLRVTVTGTGGAATPPSVAELDLGPVRPPAPAPTTPLPCVALFEVDGAPVPVALRGTLADLEAGGPLDFTSCGRSPLALDGGDHRLRARDGWLVDLVRLASTTPVPAPPAAPAPAARLVGQSATELVLDVEAAQAPYYVVSGQAYDERWQASVDGRPLGRPLLVDGYAAGWRVADLAPHRIVLTFTPQRAVEATRAVSLAALAVCLLLAVRRARRRPGGTAAESPGRADRARLPQLRRRSRAHPAGRGRAGWLVLPVLLWVVLGTLGAVLGALLAAWHLTRPPQPRTLLRAAVVVLALTPLAWLAQGLPGPTEISPGVVGQHLLASSLAAVGATLLVLGVARDTAARPRLPEQPALEPGPRAALSPPSSR